MYRMTIATPTAAVYQGVTYYATEIDQADTGERFVTMTGQRWNTETEKYDSSEITVLLDYDEIDHEVSDCGWVESVHGNGWDARAEDVEWYEGTSVDYYPPDE